MAVLDDKTGQKIGELQDFLGDIESQEQVNTTTAGTYETPTGMMNNPQQIKPAKGGLGFIPQVKASFVKDLEQKARILAPARFPNDPEAISRYGVYNGKLVYQDDDGSLRYEDDDFLPSMGGMVAPAVGAAAGGAFGSVPGAATGGAFGESVNKLIANSLGEEQTPLGNATSIATEAGLAATGQKLGNVIVNKTNSSNSFRAVKPEDMQNARQLQQDANELGINLDAADLTNSPRLKGTAHVLRMGTDDAADIYQKLDNLQNRQVVTAVKRWFDELSPTRDQVSAGSRTIKQSKKAIEEAKNARASKTGPHYTAAENETIDPQPVSDLIDQELVGAKGTTKTLLQKVKGYLYEGDKLDTTGRGLINAKKEIDRLINLRSTDKDAVDSNQKRLLTKIQQSLTAQLKQSDEYAKGSKLHKNLSPRVDALKEGVIGVLSKLKPIQAESVIQKLFGAATPNTIRQAKMILQQKDPALWDELMASWFEGEFIKAGNTALQRSGEVVNLGPAFAQRLNNPGTKAKIYAAMNTEQREVFDKLMGVLSALGRTPKGGSRTQMNQEVRGQMLDEAAPVVGKIAGAAQFWNAPREIANWWKKASLGEYSQKLAELMTNPDSLSLLKEITRLPPNSERAIKVLGSAMATTMDDMATTVSRPYIEQPRQLPQQ